VIDSEDLASVADLCTKVLIKEELTSIKQEFSARFFGYRGKSSKDTVGEFNWNISKRGRISTKSCLRT
jgi:hypothetical protein